MKFSDLSDQYAAQWGHMIVRPAWDGEARRVAAIIIGCSDRYHAVEKLSGVPWYVIGILHQMECGGRFDQHLHNGDPLRFPTINVPAGRGPFATWEASAVDALGMKKLNGIDDWSPERVAYECERYNGTGYRTRGVPSPYLWSGTSLYCAGKFTSDHCYDPHAVSKQIGAMALLRTLMLMGADVPVPFAPKPVDPEPLDAASFPRAHPEPESPWDSKTVIAASTGGVVAAAQTVKEVSASVADVKSTGALDLVGHAMTSTGVLMSLLVLAFLAFIFKERLLKMVGKGNLT